MPKWSQNWPNNLSKYALGIEKRSKIRNNILDFGLIALKVNTSKKLDRLRWNAQLINATNAACYRERTHNKKTHSYFVNWTRSNTMLYWTPYILVSWISSAVFWPTTPTTCIQHTEHGTAHTLLRSFNNIRHIHTNTQRTHTHSLTLCIFENIYVKRRRRRWWQTNERQQQQ